MKVQLVIITIDSRKIYKVKKPCCRIIDLKVVDELTRKSTTRYFYTFYILSSTPVFVTLFVRSDKKCSLMVMTNSL